MGGARYNSGARAEAVIKEGGRELLRGGAMWSERLSLCRNGEF